MRAVEAQKVAPWLHARGPEGFPDDYFLIKLAVNFLVPVTEKE